MAFRGAQIYVQGQTRHRLNLLARVIRPDGSADELADQLLNETMRSKYPMLAELEEQIAALEKRVAEMIWERAK